MLKRPLSLALALFFGWIALEATGPAAYLGLIGFVSIVLKKYDNFVR